MDFLLSHEHSKLFVCPTFARNSVVISASLKGLYQILTFFLFILLGRDSCFSQLLQETEKYKEVRGSLLGTELFGVEGTSQEHTVKSSLLKEGQLQQVS